MFRLNRGHRSNRHNGRLVARQRTPANEQFAQLKSAIAFEVEIAGVASAAQLLRACREDGRDKYRSGAVNTPGRIAAQLVECGSNVMELPSGPDFAGKQHFMAEHADMRQHIDFPARFGLTDVEIEKLH
jgi:hypothetical protein